MVAGAAKESSGWRGKVTRGEGVGSRQGTLRGRKLGQNAGEGAGEKGKSQGKGLGVGAGSRDRGTGARSRDISRGVGREKKVWEGDSTQKSKELWV